MTRGKQQAKQMLRYIFGKSVMQDIGETLFPETKPPPNANKHPPSLGATSGCLFFWHSSATTQACRVGRDTKASTSARRERKVSLPSVPAQEEKSRPLRSNKMRPPAVSDCRRNFAPVCKARYKDRISKPPLQYILVAKTQTQTLRYYAIRLLLNLSYPPSYEQYPRRACEHT